MYLILGFAFILYVSYHLYRNLFPSPNINPNGKYVLISGCDTGFGHELALELDQQGFHVLAGVFVPDNVISLQNKLTSKATVFRLDITKQEDIDATYELVKSKTNVLHALVNNAGISVGTYIDLISMDLMRQVIDVNFFGHVAMTKKFLPLLIVKRDSRVVNITSAAGYISAARVSAYCASKYALESFSDCLRREMYAWGLRVSIIEPGVMRTQINASLNKPFSEFWNSLSTDARERWGEDFLKAQHAKVAKSLFIKYAEDPMKVVRALRHAIMSTAPHIRYRPGYQSSLFLFPLSTLPAWLVDWFLRKLNQATLLPASVHKQLPD